MPELPHSKTIRDQKPPHVEVDTGKWTTKVNMSVVVAVVVVLVIGTLAAVYQLSRPHPAETEGGLPGSTETTD